MQDVPFFIQVHLSQAEHVQDQSAGCKGLPTHGVAHPGYAEWDLCVSRMLQVLAELIFG
jgi:hypothetical protein